MNLFVKTAKGLICLACPRTCNLQEGKPYCGVRSAGEGKGVCEVYGLVSSLANDPIEKKPVFHYRPGSLVLSVGTLGCNMRCLGCQNWEIAHADLSSYEWQLRRISPKELVAAAKKYSEGVAWTYNEPTVWAEYVHDGAVEAKEAGLYTVVVTNGYYSLQTFKLWEPVIDVFRIDIKGYRDETFARFAPGTRAKVVLDNVVRALEAGKHVEVVTNVMPGINSRDISQIAKFLAELSSEIPWHITRFYPQFKLTHVPPTDVEDLVAYRETALSMGLKYVYLGNVDVAGAENTYCPSCGNLLIKRSGFTVEEMHIVGDKCPHCGKKIYGVFGG
ncbi:AmmeMemoRadiSam system radical SAM enzyme [Coprothermobacteraceae bacterium]|nr:AmmeMemoRadiSam system radical SAM enzyme [Coprothermobacteraceae bacterium]